MIARLLARVRGFHGDRRAQILPLVFFVGIAFFTSTVLVINTGRTVTRRMQAQNAVDAASVSGATAIARGMNYISSNNISMAKILATIVILRAFPGAIDEANIALDIWEIAAEAMRVAGVALEATLFGAAAGVALQAIATAIKIKVKIERQILKVLKQATDKISQVLDKNGDGLLWIALKALAKLGDGLAYISPLIAQYTAKSVYAADLPGSNKWTDVWMLPLYPAMPACKGKFADFVDKVTGYAERYEKPIIIAGWVLLTLSMFPLFYEAEVKAQIEKLFTGSGTADTPTDPDSAELKKKQDELKDLQEQATKKDAEIKKYDAQIAAVNANTKPGPYDAELGRDLTTLQNKRTQLKFELQSLQDQIDAKQAEIKAISDKRLNEGGGSSDGHPAKIDDPTGGKAVKDNKDVYPYMIDGKDWPKSFTYFTVAWSKVPTPFPPTKYDVAGRKFEVFANPIGTNVVYAAARVVNPVEADLWTPAWRARLVRATAATIPTNPVGHLPAACGEEGADAGGDVPDDGGSPPDGEKTKSVLEKIVGFLSKH